jgi:hypothetical protein
MIPTFRRFTLSDFPNAPDWASQLFNPLNIFCEQTVSTFDRNLVIGENIQGMKYSATFITPTNYTTGGFNKFIFDFKSNGIPNSILVGKIAREDNARILSPVTVTDWILNTNQNPFSIEIRYIAGLLPNVRYSINLVVL